MTKAQIDNFAIEAKRKHGLGVLWRDGSKYKWVTRDKLGIISNHSATIKAIEAKMNMTARMAKAYAFFDGRTINVHVTDIDEFVTLAHYGTKSALR